MGRKYTYTLNDQVCIDSLSAGNPSRFINHSARPNCYAKVTFVNGEQRIGIFARTRTPGWCGQADLSNRALVYDLEEGEELFLDYGEDFFTEIFDHKRSKPPLQG